MGAWDIVLTILISVGSSYFAPDIRRFVKGQIRRMRSLTIPVPGRIELYKRMHLLSLNRRSLVPGLLLPLALIFLLPLILVMVFLPVRINKDLPFLPPREDPHVGIRANDREQRIQDARIPSPAYQVSQSLNPFRAGTQLPFDLNIPGRLAPVVEMKDQPFDSVVHEAKHDYSGTGWGPTVIAALNEAKRKLDNRDCSMLFSSLLNDGYAQKSQAELTMDISKACLR